MEDHQRHHHMRKQDPEALQPAMQMNEHGKHDGHSHPAHSHAGHHTEDFLKRFWLCLLLTIPALLLSHMIQQMAGFEWVFKGDQYVLLVLSTIIYFYGGWPFLTGLVIEVKSRNLGMMTLVAVAITTAYVYSVAVVFGLEGMDFFWELATLIDIMLIGHWLEMKSQMAASRALESLVALLPDVVHVQKGNQMIDIALKDLRTGDLLLVKPGEKIPADGVVTDGSSYVNESILTGESIPVQKKKDDKVTAGGVNSEGVLKIHVTGVGDETYLQKVISMVKAAQGAKSSTQNLADKVAKWLTLVSITVGVVTFIVWFSSGQTLSFALERMVTVMVTSCPHALGVAIPLVIAISTTLSATHGLLIRNRTAFENARNLTMIIFDKTGTLTKGSHEVQQILVHDGRFSADQILQYAAAIQQNSEHHIAHGVIRQLKEKGLELWASADFEYMPGIGVTGVVNGRKIVAAGPNYFSEANLPVPAIPNQVDQATDTVNFVLVDGKLAGMITFADAIREGAAEAIAALQKMKIKTFLLTGDNEKVAEAVSKKLNMDGYLAGVLPHQKLDKVKEFQARGEFVAMTGDGVNDAPALAQAEVGIAIGSGTDIAAETADIILVNSDPMDVVQLITFGRATYRKMVQNLAWAVGYNVIAIPLAAGVLYPTFMLSPAMGAVLMSASTVVVAINARLLRVR